MPLEHLFDAELEYRPGMAPLAEHGEGQLIGSGEGKRPSPAGAGDAALDAVRGPGELVCAMNPTLAIRTEDGAGIEGRGYGHRASRTGRLWRVAATLLFSAGEKGYVWLDGALGAWEGQFDAAQHSAHYRALVQTQPDTTADD